MQKVIRTAEFPIVETKKGKLHGYQAGGVFHFYGIRYGRARRFELPSETEAWEGVKDAKAFGYVCPLMRSSVQTLTSMKHDPELENNPMADPFANFEMQHVYWPMDEDCLFLNIWTKHLPGAVPSQNPVKGENGVRRPVLVWLHGGGFGTGSSIEIPSHNGHNLADYGDVVVVSINHRLNCLGFLDLSGFGEEFTYSGIAGMADIVLALKWVRENIAAFGGDPENVTVAGQSGGGGKAMDLLQMPSADGLYRRIISQSGASGGFGRKTGKSFEEEKAVWQALGNKTAELLGFTPETIEGIREVPYEVLSDAAEEAGKSLGYEEGMMLFEPSPVPGFFTGRYEMAGFREETKDVAVLAGTVLGEFQFMQYLGDKSAYSEEERQKLLRDRFGERTEDVLTEFKRVYPGIDPLYSLSVDTIFRPKCIDYLDARKAFSEAPCYNYQMSFIIPYKGGVTPWHCSCIPFMFRNVELEPAQCTGAGIYAEKVEEEVSRAWLAFMECGDPSTPSLPWRPYTKSDRCRMEFSESSRMNDTDDSKLITLLTECAAGYD